MSIAQDIIGTHYRYPDYFVVDREKIREFARRSRTIIPPISPKAAAEECGTTR